eukprot:SAG22_NODE_1125_length_5476_cov_11.823322_5_plen_157_part_00
MAHQAQEPEPEAQRPAPQLTDMPVEVINHIGSHLQPHSMLRLGQALKTTIGREFRIGHMKDYHNYAASKIQSVLKTPSTQVVNMYGRRYQQRDWKSGDPGRKDRLQMPQVESDDAAEYTSTLHDRLGRQIMRDGSIKFKAGTLSAQPRRGYSGFTR